MERVREAYQEFAFHKVYRTLYDFATVDLSAFYFDILKDRLYTAPAGSVRRRAAQSVLYRIAEALVRAVAPLMCFTADEVWSHLPPLADGERREASVHLAAFLPPARLREGLTDRHLKALENWPQLIAVRGEVLKALEAARVAKSIGGSLEARVVLHAEGDLAAQLVSVSRVSPDSVHRLAGRFVGGGAQRNGGVPVAGPAGENRARRGREMPPLLELLRAGGQGRSLPASVRTLLRRPQGNRGGDGLIGQAEDP